MAQITFTSTGGITATGAISGSTVYSNSSACLTGISASQVTGALGYNPTSKFLDKTGTSAQTVASVVTFSSGCYGALWNDLADCIPIQSGLNPEPGYCYRFDGENYKKTIKYLDEQFIGIHSDTYGFAMGKEKDKTKLDVAVAGFVLAYTDKKYKTGTPLTCDKNGILTRIKLFDRIFHPHMIVATYWKDEHKKVVGNSDKTVIVDNRNWVKIR